ncbi:MAG: CDP-alcohol phosphatidyltransferase family protein [Planctomycetes bacterium]|nr:CDP-alcohol phosphatidyltransferase family protein [Planctomycetota bacterium]
MPSIYDIKPRFQALLRPTTRALAQAGATANHVTIAAMLGSFAVGATVFVWGREHAWPLFLVPGFLFLRMALNAIDGMLAREHDMKSALGAMLNELGDVFSDTALYLPLAVVPAVSPPAIVGVAVLAIISEMAGVVAIQIGAGRRYDGPMGKSDRAFVFGVLTLALGLGWRNERGVAIVLAAVNILLFVTIANRCRSALREASPERGSDAR